MRRLSSFIGLPALGMVLGSILPGCDPAPPEEIPPIDPDLPPVTEGEWYRPAPSVTWQWQLQGTVNTSYSAEIYDIDLFDSSTELIEQLQAVGRKVICYFSAGSYEQWRPDAGQFPAQVLGNSLDGWPGERWLDIRSAAVLAIMQARLDLAVEKGCDGVEPDNMDGYANGSGFPLTSKDQLTYNRTIANQSHLRGLSVALKNDLEQLGGMVEYFDFAVNEQCFQYSECDLLVPFIDQGKAVLNAEYRSRYVNNEAARNALCAESLNRQLSTLVLPLELDDAFRFSCL